jgi:5-methyltetrahydrofolate--homocysteine methyltransferase
MVRGHVNIIGGCCGTTPAHIREFAKRAAGKKPRVAPPPAPLLRLSGLEPLTLFEGSNLINIGERTNVAGSRRFARLIREEQYEEALAVARQQVENGAQVIDVSMDDAMLDAKRSMVTFLNLLAADPEIARVPVMIDSSKWEVLEAGLKCLQGKGIVNSISLKEGEEEFIARARSIRLYGAAVVVMAFDEEGQATSFERRIQIAERAYRLLTEKAAFPPEDIIFDLNVLAIGTGLEEHNRYAVEFIEAVRWVKEHLPYVHTSGGISNLSFSFRGHNPIREAMHAAFLYHAVKAGLDMAIVNAGRLPLYDDIPRELLERVEDLIFDRRPDATERLLEYAAAAGGEDNGTAEKKEAWRQLPLKERIIHSLVKGIPDYVEEDMQEAIEAYPTALDIIEGPMMEGMNRVGDLFGSGKMFLPQVIKSARVMKRAVAVLEPVLEEEKAAGGGRQQAAGRVLLATVKGDVHDIGKNIVGVVLACNNYEVIDLGVMVPGEKILAAAREKQADLIGLSGLITPSLDEMVQVAREMERQGFDRPLLIGGATTSKLHTAVKIAPAYSGPVVHVLDASRAAPTAGRLLGEADRAAFLRENRDHQERLRARRARERATLVPLAEARRRAFRPDWSAYTPPRPDFLGPRALSTDPADAERGMTPVAWDELAACIDWSPFFHAWELRGRYPAILEHERHGEQARQLLADARAMLDRLTRERWLVARAVYGFWPAQAVGDDVRLFADDRRAGVAADLRFLRQQTEKPADRPFWCLADFVAPAETGREDYLGGFAVTVGHGMKERVEAFKAAHDDYNAILLESLADRLAEAFAEWLHRQARRDWGYGRDEQLANEELIAEKYRGIRPAPGYPACPDHTEKRTLWRLLDVERRAGIRLTESCAMWPAASVSGWYFSHPDSRYFVVGALGRDQITDYAARKQMPVSEVERWLARDLGYEPEET